jgi:hypothetical protein
MSSEVLIDMSYCRYCLSTDNNQDFITPCKCKGSAEYVHTNCLKEWLKKKNNRPIIPAFFSQYNYSCEICNTEYDIEYKRSPLGEQVYFEILFYVFMLSSFLTLSYLLLGLFMETYTGFLVDINSRWDNVFCNGFITCHIIIDIAYILAALWLNRESCICCLVLDCQRESDINMEPKCVIFVCILLVSLSIAGAVLIIYYDIISRTIQRARNRSKYIVCIKPYNKE